MAAILGCSNPRQVAPPEGSDGTATGSKACTLCHGDGSRNPSPTNPYLAAAPPSGTHGETATSTRAVGAHLLHLQGGELRPAVACGECHVVPTTTAHSNGRVDVTFGPLATAGGAAPQWNGSTCSSTYCHGGFPGGDSANAPSWTSPRSPACGTCHGLPPASPHPSVAAGTSCGNCHSGYGAGTVNLADHMNGKVDVAGLACSSCHGDPARLATALNPQLAAAPPQGSKGETATTTRAVGAHAIHLRDGNFIACTECHVVPASTSHSNGTAEVSFGALARTGGVAPSWNGSTCSNVYCHGAFTGGNASYAPTWTAPAAASCGTCHGLPPASPHPQGTSCSACHEGYTATSVNAASHLNGRVDVSAAGCTACHGDPARAATALEPNLPAAPPKDTAGNTATSFPGVGAHQAHLNAGALAGAMTCGECHLAPPAGTHPSGTTEFRWGSLASSGGATPGYAQATRTCTNYCHGATMQGGSNTSPTWTGGSAEVACGACHGLPPAAPHPSVAATASCGDCHSGYTRTTVVAATHVNGSVEVATLSCTSCHGDSTRAATAANPQLPAAPPKDAKGNTATTARGVGAHQRHLVAGALSAAVACAECHVVPTSSSHANGTAEMTFGTLARTGGASPAWNGTTCSGSYCHGNFRNGNLSYAPSWTAPATSTCGTCHGTASSPAPGGTHPSVLAGSTCGSCHDGYTATSVNLATHMNGVVESSMTCTSCHGNSSQNATQVSPLYAAPPLGTKGETATTTRAVGAHQAHLTGTTLRAAPVGCAECHAVPASTAHATGAVDMTWGTLARSGGATPAWTGATCTNYCHGATLQGGTVTSPSWTGGATQVATCGACHGAPPPSPHVQNAACGSCHPDSTATAANRANHLNGSVETVTLTCTTCHGSATRTPTSLNPQLASAPPTDTRGGTATSSRGVGAHMAHLTGTTLRASALACTECHAIPSSQAHANGTVEMAWGALARAGNVTPAWNGATCTNYCHGASLNAGGTTVAPTWTGGAAQVSGCTTCHGNPPPSPHVQSSACANCHGSGYASGAVDKALHLNGSVDVPSLGCTSCHGNAAQSASQASPLYAAPPVGTRGETATTTRAVGAHQAHLVGTRLRSTAVACTECHAVPGSSSHSNGIVDLAWGTLARTGNVNPSWNGATCTNYCHGASLSGGAVVAPSWTGGASQASGCNACHGNPPALPHPQSTDCAACHGAGTSATTVNTTTHMNGTVELPGVTCTSCHGTATRTATALNPQLPAAPPVGTLGETATSTRAVGAHLAHLQDGALRVAMACTECHAVPASTSHSNGTVDLTWGTLARAAGTPSWNPTALTCTNYCHGASLSGGTLTAPKWTNGSVEVTCGSCHGSPPPAPHPAIAAGTSCGQCHGGYTATTVNVNAHVNGVVDVLTLTCTSCHGNSAQTATQASPLYAAPPLGTKGETATTTRAVGAHQAHLTGTTLRSAAIACSECHAVPGSTAHSNGAVDMTWGTLAKSGGATPAWNGATCTNYCHGSTLNAGGTVTAPTWTGGSTQDACGTCHGVPPPAPHTTDTNCGTCHTGYTSTSVNKTLHMNGVVDATSTHPAGWSAGNQHGYQANLTGLAGCKSCHGATLAGGTGPSCTACHTTNGFATWDTNCTFCHGNRTSGRQSPPVDVQGRTATSNTSVGRHDSHVASTMITAITCAACHPARSTSVITDTAHVDGNGVAEVTLKSFSYTSGSSTTTVAGTYTRTSATAATCTVYCHSNFPTSSGGARIALSESWVATTTSSCTSCHSTKSSRHTAGQHASYACGTCHGTGYTSSAVTGAAVASHVDGVKTIVTTATGTGIRTWNPATRTCTASCHGSDTW